MGRRAVPHRVPAHGAGVRRRRDCPRRGGAHRRHPDPCRRVMGKPWRAARRSVDGPGRRRTARSQCDQGPSRARRQADRTAQEGLPDRPGCDNGDQRAQSPPRACLQAAHGGRRPARRHPGRAGHHRRGERGRPDQGPGRRSRADHGHCDQDGHRGPGLRLRQGVCRPGAARDRPGDPGEEGANPQQGSDATVPLRLPPRHPEVPQGPDPASDQARGARALLLLQGQGLSQLSAAGRLPVTRSREQGRRGERRPSGPAACPQAQGEMV